MIGLVRMALRRPYTAAVSALLILMLGAMSVTRMIVDIFPIIDIPVVLVVWNYPGLSTEDMERRVVFITERSYSTSVNGIQRMESQSIPGTGMIKVYFEPGTDISSAISQITANNNTVLRVAPPGMTPPTVIPFNASSVPVVQLGLFSKTLSEQQIFDYSTNFLRLQLFTIPGLSTPAPYGGKFRQITVDLDPVRMGAKGFSPNDVVQALQTSNVIIPAGNARIGDTNFQVALNSSPTAVDQFNRLPLGIRNGIPVLMGDVSKVSDGFSNQTNIVHVNGQRAIYLAILRHADASTLAVVQATKDALPMIRAAAPEGLEVKLDFDQSVFVSSAVENVVHEAMISSVLVSLMILLFLGSWRNTLIVSISIPLSIFAGLAGLFLAGQSINLMTLGGLALAIGLLVDNATVTIENIHRNQSLGKPLTVAILDGCSEVIQPLTVATLAICIVFCPVLLLQGPARFLFIPLALTVVLAMLASYVLSFTVLPALTRYVLAQGGDGHHKPGRFTILVERVFDGIKEIYGRMLERVLDHRIFTLVTSVALLLSALALGSSIGTDFFPTADVGIIKLHMRGPHGLRLEETEKLVLLVEDKIREIIPAAELRTINDVDGVPPSINLAFVPMDNVGDMDAEILISLNTPHRPSIDYIRAMRAQLPTAFPDCLFYFQNADIVSQVLNFGASSPIDVQVADSNFDRARRMSQRILQGMQKIPGVADPHIVQVFDYPGFQIDVDRLRAARLGITQRDVSNNLLISLSSSALVASSYFINPENGVNYTVAVQTPIDKVSSVSELMDIPVSQPSLGILQAATTTTITDLPSSPVTRLSDISSLKPKVGAQSLNHYTVQRVVDVAANIDGRDLGGVAGDIQKVIDELKPDMPLTMNVTIRGQNEVMTAAFRSLGLGLILAIILVYALLVVLFQSWVDPFIIMMAVPGALIGILWMLTLTHTTINVESLMGTIMTVGISVSNSILVVSFANQIRVRDNLTPRAAALEAAKTRLRPILMTALAMIIGMIPMALGAGEAGEQNAPLGRAVIGGLAMATVATLFLVPVIYTLLRRQPPTLYELDRRFEAEAAGSLDKEGATHG